MLKLTLLDVVSVVVIFFVSETVLSRVFVKWGRDQPF
jgi:hypothetical protein